MLLVQNREKIFQETVRVELHALDFNGSRQVLCKKAIGKPSLEFGKERFKITIRKYKWSYG
jgi:hypothetical protein